jgi:uncharacterized delta-60 repeat protein
MVQFSSMSRTLLRAMPFVFAVRAFFTHLGATADVANHANQHISYSSKLIGLMTNLRCLLVTKIKASIDPLIRAKKNVAVRVWRRETLLVRHEINLIGSSAAGAGLTALGRVADMVSSDVEPGLRRGSPTSVRSKLSRSGSIVFTSLVSLMSTNATSAPTDLDPTFATSGLYEYTTGTGLSSVNVSALQPDGASVHAGSCTTPATGSRPCIFRLTANGAFDNGFGTGAVGEPRSLSGMASVLSIAVDSQGRVVTVGDCANATGTVTAMCAQRRLSDGTLDSTFAGGTVALLEQAPSSYANSVLIDGSDRVLMAGKCEEKTWCVVRLTMSGVLDQTFANGTGIARRVWPGLIQTYSEINVLVANVDGSYIAAGRCNDTAGGIRACVASLNASGTAFSAFGSGTFWIGRENSRVAAAGFQASGKLVLIGSCNDASANDICLIRLTSSGLIDTSFGTAGYVRTLVATTSGARAGAIQEDGRIIVVGICSGQGCAVRYDINGALDRSFGLDGVYRPGGNVVQQFTTIHIDALGRLLFGGICFDLNAGSVLQCVQRSKGGPTDYARCSLDVDGDGVIASEVDRTLLLRSTMGFSEDRVTEGLSFPTHALRKNASEIRRFLITHCKLRLP